MSRGIPTGEGLAFIDEVVDADGIAGGPALFAPLSLPLLPPILGRGGASGEEEEEDGREEAGSARTAVNPLLCVIASISKTHTASLTIILEHTR